MLRPRSEVDLAACEAIAREVHALDGYPPYMPDDDFHGFLVAHDVHGAWVAVIEDRVVGHFALHRRSTRAVMRLATSATGEVRWARRCRAAVHCAERAWHGPRPGAARSRDRGSAGAWHGADPRRVDRARPRDRALRVGCVGTTRDGHLGRARRHARRRARGRRST